MAGETVADVAMQQAERQHRSYKWWKQYAADANDDASGLLMKRQKLLILRQAIAAYIGIGKTQNDISDAIADPQDLHKRSAAAQQQHSDIVRQLANPAAAKPNVQLQCQNTVTAATAQQNHERVSGSPQRPQQQQHEEHHGSKANHHHQQQLHDEQHDRLSHRDLLCRLLGPAIPATGGGGPSTAAEAAPDQQEHLEQQQQPWQRRTRQKPAARLPGHLQQWPAQQKLQQAVQQRRQVQQTGGRRRLLQQQPSNLAQHPAEQQQHQHQGERILQQPRHEQQSRSEQQHQVQQLEQQQQQVRRVHVGNQLCDAQSQAVAPAAGAGFTTAAPAVGSGRGSGAVQQLFSPRTAEHVPNADGGAWQISCAAEPLHMKQQQPLQHQQQSQQQPQHQQQQVWSPGLKGHKAAADKQQQQRQRFVCQQQQQQQEEAARAASPPGSPQQQTQLSLQHHPSPPAAAEVVIASTPTPCKMVPGTPYSPEPAPNMTSGAAAAAATAAAVVGDAGSDQCAVFGSYVAESPAAAAAPRSVVKGQNAAAPAVVSIVAQRLFGTAPCPLQQEQEPRANILPADSATAAAVSAVAGDVVVQTDSRQCLTMQQQQQQQRQQVQPVDGKQIGGKHGLSHAKALVHTGGAAQAVAGRSSSSSSSVCLNIQQRSVQINVGLPVTKIVTCQQQCLVIMQQHSSGSSSNQFELLHLQLQKQQQQQEGWDIALGGSATVTVPEHRAGAAVAAAAAASLVDRGIKLLPVQQCVTDNDKVHHGDATHSSLLQGALIAAAAPLELAINTGQHTGTAAVPPAAAATAAAAVTPPGLGMRGQELHEPADRVMVKTPGSGICSDLPAGKRSLRSKLSNSSGKRKALHSRLGPAAAAAGDDTEHHGVNIYRLSRTAKGASSADPEQQQQQGTVVHVQRLATEVAVTCLAVCEQQLLLAAAGSAGYACVWKLNRCSSTSSATQQQQQLQQQGQIITAASEESRAVLPAAAYRGISFPDITDLCFLVQPGSSSSSSSARVLLVGSCNQGSLAVWDVQLRQQIIAVHNPDVNVHGLLPLQSPVSSSSSAVGSDTRGSCYAQQQQQPDLLLFLALVGGKDNAGVTTLTPLPIAAAAGSGVAGAAAHVTPQQQQQQRRRHLPKRELELRPILLQQPGSLILGASVLSTAQDRHHQQQQCSVAVQTAAVCGSLAAAACGGDTGTSVKVWDLISGRTVATAELPGTAAAAATAGDVLSVGLINMSQQIQQQQQHEVEDAGRHSPRDGVRGVVLMGSSANGILTMAMI